MDPPNPWAFHHLGLTYGGEEPVDQVRAVEYMSEFAAWFGYSDGHRIETLVEALGGDATLREEATGVLDDMVNLTVLKPTDLIFWYAQVASPDRILEILQEAIRARHMKGGSKEPGVHAPHESRGVGALGPGA